MEKSELDFYSPEFDMKKSEFEVKNLYNYQYQIFVLDIFSSLSWVISILKKLQLE